MIDPSRVTGDAALRPARQDVGVSNSSPDLDPLDGLIDYSGGGNGWRNTRTQRDTYVGEGIDRGTDGLGTEQGFSLTSSRTGYSSRGVNDLEGPELAQRAAEERQRQRELAERAQEAIAEHDLSGEMETPEDPSDETTGPRPIVLDLDGNGISVTELSQSQHDVDGGDGLLHRTAWAAAGDGVLFFDVDGDGQIKEKREYVFTEWDPTSASDLDELRAVFDTNGDGKLTAKKHVRRQIQIAA